MTYAKRDGAKDDNGTGTSPESVGQVWGDIPEKIAPPWRDRFLAKIDRRGPDDCWPCIAAKMPTGYGFLGINSRPHYAHRMAHELWIGPVGAGMNVNHRCDNRCCTNPAHLYAGTQAENMRDRYANGWMAKSRKLGKLTRDERLYVLHEKRRHMATARAMEQLKAAERDRMFADGSLVDWLIATSAAYPENPHAHVNPNHAPIGSTKQSGRP